MSVIFIMKYTNPNLCFKQPQSLTLLTNCTWAGFRQSSSAPCSIKWGNTKVVTDLMAGGWISLKACSLMYLMVVAGYQLGIQLDLSVRTLICGSSMRLFGFLIAWRLVSMSKCPMRQEVEAASFWRRGPGNW